MYLDLLTPPPATLEGARLCWFQAQHLILPTASPQIVAPLWSQCAPWIAQDTELLYLGQFDAIAWYALRTAPLTLNASWQAFTLRELLLLPECEEHLFMMAGRAAQLLDWAQTHRFCSRCAAPLVPQTKPGTYCRRCSACQLDYYPRLAPVVIMRVTRGAEILLSRAAHFRPGMYSVQAGFVESGETLEQALQRELWEELAIEVGNIHYFGSQCWPFPHSLMMAFSATYITGTLRLQAQEVEHAAWFGKDNLPLLPPQRTIAYQLIDTWRRADNG